MFPEIGWVKKILSLTRLHSQMYIRIYIFNFKNKQSKNGKTNKNTRKQKKLKKKREFLWKKNLRPPGGRFSSSPAFPETRVFFWTCCRKGITRSSHPEVCKKVVLEKFAEFTGKHLFQSARVSFLIKLQTLGPQLH